MHCIDIKNIVNLKDDFLTFNYGSYSINIVENLRIVQRSEPSTAQSVPNEKAVLHEMISTILLLRRTSGMRSGCVCVCGGGGITDNPVLGVKLTRRACIYSIVAEMHSSANCVK